MGKRSNRVVRTLQNSKCGRLLDETARCLGQGGPEGLAFVTACPPPPQQGALDALGKATGRSALTRSSLEVPNALGHSS